jgi:hypothetical protein
VSLQTPDSSIHSNSDDTAPPPPRPELCRVAIVCFINVGELYQSLWKLKVILFVNFVSYQYDNTLSLSSHLVCLCPFYFILRTNELLPQEHVTKNYASSPGSGYYG